MLDPIVKHLELARLTRTEFITSLSGRLATKRGVRAKKIIEEVKRKLYSQAKELNWKFAQRAKLAVSLLFFDYEQNKADIHKLVKFYLDALQGPIFRDDRQVYYLDAYLWRIAGSSKESLVFIKVRRLHEFIRLLDYADECDLLAGDDEFIPSAYFRKELEQNQHDRLVNIKIADFSRPGLAEFLQPTVARHYREHPLIFDLGELPQKDVRNQFKQTIERTIDAFKFDENPLNPLFVPIELDVQVNQPGLKVAKDLDNIMSHICPAIKNSLLEGESYINGYRIYVVQNLSLSRRSAIQLQLLPMGAISRYHNRLEKGLEVAREQIEDEI